MRLQVRLRPWGLGLVVVALAGLTGCSSAGGRPLPEVVPHEFREVVRDDGRAWESEPALSGSHGALAYPVGADLPDDRPAPGDVRGDATVEDGVVRVKIRIATVAGVGSPIVEAHAALFPVSPGQGESLPDAAQRALAGPPAALTTVRPADDAITPGFEVPVAEAPWHTHELAGEVATWVVSVLLRAESGVLERLVVEVSAPQPTSTTAEPTPR